MKLPVLVKPNSKKGPLIEKGEDYWTIFVRESAIDDQANQAVIKLLAKELKVAKTKINLKRGHKSKLKVFEIGDT